MTYQIILAIFTLAGFIVSIWGLTVITKSRQIRAWPVAQGVITRTELRSIDDPMLPLIEYRYKVEQSDYAGRLIFPKSVSPSDELSKMYVERYPENTQVNVYYNPENPSDSTLETSGSGDWLILVIGLLMFGFGLFFLFVRV